MVFAALLTSGLSSPWLFVISTEVSIGRDIARHRRKTLFDMSKAHLGKAGFLLRLTKQVKVAGMEFPEEDFSEPDQEGSPGAASRQTDKQSKSSKSNRLQKRASASDKASYCFRTELWILSCVE